jgi:hypothetical protein
MATKKTVAKKTAKSAELKTATATQAHKAGKSSRTETRQDRAAIGKSKARKPAALSGAGKGDGAGARSDEILARAEHDVTKLLESLNTQMTAAMHAFEELAAIHRGRGEAVIRTRPLDRATAMFQRLVTEVVDERLGEVLPTLVGLRVEMDQRAKAEGNGEASAHGEFFTRGTEMLDQILANAEVQAFQPNIGDAYDPLIHLAVGETSRSDLANDVVSEVLQIGFRTVRGKVIQAARVKVNRR